MLEYIYYLRIGLALVLSLIIGWEREHSDKEAGVRTIMLISLGTVSLSLIPFVCLGIPDITFDFTRVLSYIIGGIGFMSGIVIINQKKKVEGITTSACIWSVVSYSLLCGLGEYILATFIGIVVYIILKSKYFHVKLVKRGGQSGKKNSRTSKGRDFKSKGSGI